MTKLQKILDYSGAVIDYIPGLATIVNGSILIYQRAHKVNEAANPVNKGWKSDLKIYMLSKDKMVAKSSLIPVIGTIGALITHVARHKNFRNWSNIGYKINRCLTDATDVNPSKRNHSLELVRLYLECNPDIDPAELELPLRRAATHTNIPLFELLLGRMGELSTDTITSLLTIYCRSEEIANRVLDAPHEQLRLENQEQIVKECYHDATLLAIIPRFPAVSEKTIRHKLQHLIKQDLAVEQLTMLLDRCGNMSDRQLLKVLKNATPNNCALIYEQRECSIDLRLAEMGHHLNSETFESYKTWVEDNEAQLTDAQKALVLKPIQQYQGAEFVEFAREFAERNRNLSGPAAVEVLEQLHAWDVNFELYSIYFNTFENLTAENLQPLYQNILLQKFKTLYLGKFPELENTETS